MAAICILSHDPPTNLVFFAYRISQVHKLWNPVPDSSSIGTVLTTGECEKCNDGVRYMYMLVEKCNDVVWCILVDKCNVWCILVDKCNVWDILVDKCNVWDILVDKCNVWCILVDKCNVWDILVDKCNVWCILVDKCNVVWDISVDKCKDYKYVVFIGTHLKWRIKYEGINAHRHILALFLQLCSNSWNIIKEWCAF